MIHRQFFGVGESNETAMLHSLISVSKDDPKFRRLCELKGVGDGTASKEEKAEWCKLLRELTEEHLGKLSEEHRRLAEEQLRLLEEFFAKQE
jgi:hypothetical protein